MEKRTLYRATKNGKTTVSPSKPTDGTYTETYRLIADEGMVLTDGTNTYACIDTNEPDIYAEVVDENADGDYAEAGKILLGVSE